MNAIMIGSKNIAKAIMADRFSGLLRHAFLL
jgi:hypothetical protein